MSMTCSTLCDGVGVSVSDLIIDGYFTRIRLTGSGMFMLTSCSGVDAAMWSAAALRGCLTSFVGAAGAVAAAASYLGRDLTTFVEVGWPRWWRKWLRWDCQLYPISGIAGGEWRAETS